MHFFESQWASALSDLKDAAHDADLATPEQTDAWSIQHHGNMAHVLGYYLANGDFREIASVSSPDAVRNLRHTLKFIA